MSSEIKDGQWLGVEVKSQGEGGKVIVCAHRYKVRDKRNPEKETKRGMIGLCYILDPSLQILESDSMGYKSVMVIRETLSGKRQEPFKDFDDHAEWGVCQVGTSATFVQDNDLEEDENLALFGAPGCFTWRGNIFAQQVGTYSPYDMAVNGDTFVRYAKHGLMGMAVTSGRFFNNKLYFVSGAPHANTSGQVYFFTREGSTGLLKPRQELTFEVIFKSKSITESKDSLELETFFIQTEKFIFVYHCCNQSDSYPTD